ncbi:MAG TPA: 50S ribosomal protein L15 [Chloroflexota bacterium]|nr:50S ribosomal protein L15 [Chloroflexota bacterium]
MKLEDIRAPQRRTKRRLGRGHGSGRVKTSGRGQKGQSARKSGPPRPGFEGGQLPLVQRLPYLKGFKNNFKVSYQPVNLDQLRNFETGTTVDPESLVKAGVLGSTSEKYKLLARGSVDKKLTVRAHKFSVKAREAIEAAGGAIEEIAS